MTVRSKSTAENSLDDLPDFNAKTNNPTFSQRPLPIYYDLCADGPSTSIP